jgi:hypothetical protein
MYITVAYLIVIWEWNNTSANAQESCLDESRNASMYVR